ncbi:SDR family NAD(P)-dependent oxidoreductase [Saccharothrix longispora]|uniref:Acyl transferase domain-containing protein/NAD(P)H-dependent flavin oxidoreductase YrpB (Nitropropane dioxygenase family) n=1 Tax=Saccharothrix longispora TaxID=33920 RepID=A0ABU1PVP2_9PSEU|nr:SDR family NAD(P)-dependent oxidoreductase [Saccharothrix longispora]MDR6594705.1 acyl transferase domain-containing protein/NAD(P)H-dependent flavin oxidoreductase YrpB (nitropropane dioxygenase family) [Saccharothrix longispora]
MDVSELVVAVDPIHHPAPRLTAAAARAGALGVLELPAGDLRAATDVLDRTARWTTGRFGVRVRPGCAVPDLPDAADTVLLADPARTARDFPDRRVLVEVVDLAEARAAVDSGAAGLVVRGREAGGRVGGLSTFVLLQQVLAAVDVPVWAAGGIGPHTAAAAVAGGASGVVLDTQLALFADAGLPVELTAALDGLDGSETVLHQGHRVLKRRGPGVPELPADDIAGQGEPHWLGPDLRTQFPPVGQDVALASAFARRWPTAGAAIRGVRDAVLAAIADDAAVRVLGPGSTGARHLGTALPVVQGPMTRVSDRPGFAAAVADGGGLPFLALALSGPGQTRDLLTRTRDELGDRPWGVGVLGFAAEDVRAAQLAVVKEVRPTHAIIAGGRPAQAADLEAAGVSAFLHVPSPGLLRQFLAAGARKFVFEGAECGGHVGPRHSFPLWESQVDVLLDHLAAGGEAGELTVLFAGGVHDERSAAMVAALATPLARAGAGVGVLMGTAYLFTEEAVGTGAIGPVFQRHVVDADRTDLLETAPGHATRCVRSGFTGDFAALRDDLRAAGVPDREAWERLERFNVGRLRVASKGVERVGDDLRPVPVERQAAEGMFMAGDVSVLRDAVTTIAGLHDSVGAAAGQWLAERLTALRAALVAPEPEPEPAPLRVAIVGMACVFPGATDLASFWANVLSGADSVTEVPAERWDQELYYDPDGTGERTPSRWGGFLPRIPFDPLAYGIPPASLGAIEPVQLLALETARRALEDAGYPHTAADHRRTSVVFGAESGSDLSNATTLRTVLPAYTGALPPELDAQLPRLTEDSFPGMLANVIAGRVANRLDLGGANYTVDAACASSLTAVDVACKELVAGTSDLVVAGGADLHNGINDYLLFSSVHALSPSGRSATFDRSADGIALGEGVACVVLKRLDDALRDGDRVYAVVDGVGSASDGRALGLTAPRPEGQRAALERAYRMAGVSPARVGLVEAHGTGTVVGDRTELRTLTEVFTEAGAEAGACALGSVKSQIGHTKCAAGLAGLIKAALAVHHGVRPPTLHLREPNPAWEPERSPFAFHTAARPWVAPPAERVAGVSAFGFGGTNFHVVLRAHDQAPAAHALDRWPAELFLFRGTDPAAAARAAAAVLEQVEATPAARLRDFARGAATRADVAALRGDRVWLAVVAGDVAQLRERLRLAVSGGAGDGVFTADVAGTGSVAFLYPGQGSQRPGMLADLLVAFPELHRYLELGARWAGALYPPAAFDPAAEAAQRARITDTAVAQPALGVVELAATDLLASVGVRPDAVAGHSYGELVALAAAGVFDPADLLAASAARAEAILAQVRDGDPGAMAAVTAPADEVEAVLAAADLPVVAANRNSPKQTVVSGPTDAVAAAVRALRDAGHPAKPLPVACAFHSPLVAGAGAVFRRVLDAMPLRAPSLPVWANRTAATYPASADAVRDGLAAQIGAPVRFAEQVLAMHDAGVRVFVEVGPGRVLSGLVPAVLGDRPHRVVHLGEGLPGLLTALARLAVAGVDVRTGPLVRGRDAADPSAVPASPGWTVDGHLVRRADGAIQPGALRPARRITEPIVSQHPATPVSSDALVADFLRTSREMIAAQRDVLMTYFGATGAVGTVAAPPVAPAVVRAVAAPVVDAVPTAAPAPVAADVLRTVVEVVAERTGYPVEMVEPGLDLEADLSVDSIKRAEIAGEIATRLGLDAGAGEALEALSAARTAAAIADLIEQRRGGAPGPAESAAPEPGAAEPGAAEPVAAPLVVAPRRLVFREHDLPAPTSDARGTRVVVVGAPDEAVTSALIAAGVEIGLEVAGTFVIHLGALDAGESLLPEEFPNIQSLLAAGPRGLLAVDRREVGAVTGLRGFFRTLDREYPDLATTLVEVPADAGPDAVAAALLAELAAADHEPVVLAGPGTRRGLRLTETDLGPVAAAGAGPAGDGAAEAEAAGLDRDAVVLLAGGARGITARFARTLAAAGRCRLELLGRTPAPLGPEEPDLAAATDRAGLRAAFLARGLTSPAEVERAVSATLVEREVRTTLADLGDLARYHAVDVLDAEAVRATVKRVHDEHGRLDAVVYAAGVIEDKLVADKSVESFRRVFGTKVDGARTLLDAVDALPAGPRYAVLFGSIAAALGNRGQCDYAAANDALEELGRRWSRPGRRGLTVHWGPWAGGGMVSPELARSYAARGVALIDPEEGPLSLLRELAWGPADVHAVVSSASGW